MVIKHTINNANTWKKSNLVRISEEILQSERGVNSNDTSNTREKVILLCEMREHFMDSPSPTAFKI